MAKQIPPVTSKSGNKSMVNEPVIIDRTPEHTMYDLIEVYIQYPAITPDPENLVYARPYEFDDNRAIKYSATSPHCGCGLDFGPSDITTKYGLRFLKCQCTPKSAPIMIDDPFINPIETGIIDINGEGSVVATVPATLEMQSNLGTNNITNIEDIDSIVDEILGL